MKSSKQTEQDHEQPPSVEMKPEAKKEEPQPLIERIQEATHNMQERLHNYHPFEHFGKTREEDEEAEDDFFNLFG
ncbi:hypothetical protein Cantr_03623 [Candida viswanathii]|uniref:Uncharacterized protein n=1 Tax=Candida viswanathii TaxID=5486 RepID=A0A367XLY1_9ASCO|nr:hypothetical protein Cantr_03623 [Candida viswanathii]